MSKSALRRLRRRERQLEDQNETDDEAEGNYSQDVVCGALETMHVHLGGPDSTFSVQNSIVVPAPVPSPPQSNPFVDGATPLAPPPPGMPAAPVASFHQPSVTSSSSTIGAGVGSKTFSSKSGFTIRF